MRIGLTFLLTDSNILSGSVINMASSIFSEKEREYRQAKNELCEIALKQAAELHISAVYIHRILTQGMQTVVQPKEDSTEKQFYTPNQLKYVIEMLLQYPPELAACIVTIKMYDVITQTKYPLTLMVDIMMALEKIRAIFPEHASKGAAILAASVCMINSAAEARDTLKNIGAAYNHLPLTEMEVTRLDEEGLISDPPEEITVDGNTFFRMGDDLTIRNMVKEYLVQNYPKTAKVIID